MLARAMNHPTGCHGLSKKRARYDCFDARRRTRSYRALLTGLAKAFRSSHESARAVSCS